MKKIFFIFLFTPILCFSQNDYISNKDYSEFVTYVRDSLFRLTMGQEVDEEAFHISTWDIGDYNVKDTFVCINWKAKLDVNTPWAREALEPWYYKPEERYNRKREVDTRKLIHNKVAVYPDEMIWCRDSTINKSWAVFLTANYFSHSYFQEYPVCGLSEQQITEYLKWKYPNKNKHFKLDETKEIKLILPKDKLKFTVGDYFKFYQDTRDSIVRNILGSEIDEYKYLLSSNKYGEEISPPLLKWKTKIKWRDVRIETTLKKKYILTSDNKIDSRFMNYDYYYLDYYKALTVNDSADRNIYIGRTMINLGIKEYTGENLPNDIKKQLKDKREFTYKNAEYPQLKAYYYWKKEDYNGKDVYENFIPYCNNTFCEVDLLKCKEDNDIELFRTGKLSNNFYNFNYTIPMIIVE